MKKILLLLFLGMAVPTFATDKNYGDFMKQMPETLDYFGRTFKKVKYSDMESEHPRWGYSLLYAENLDDIFQKCRVSLIIYDDNYNETKKNDDGSISCINNKKNDNPITKDVVPCELKKVMDVIHYVIPDVNDFHFRGNEDMNLYGTYGTGDKTYEAVSLFGFDGHFIKSRVTCYKDSVEKDDDSFLMSVYHLITLMKEMKTYFKF